MHKVPHQQNSVSIKNTIATTVNSDLKKRYNAKSNEIINCQNQTQNQLLVNESLGVTATSGFHQSTHSVSQQKDQPNTNANLNIINYNSNTNNNTINNSINYNSSNNNNNNNTNNNNLINNNINNLNNNINNSKRPLSNYSDTDQRYYELNINLFKRYSQIFIVDFFQWIKLNLYQ